MPQGQGVTSSGSGNGGTRTRESKTKGVDKKAMKRQQTEAEKQPKQKVVEDKAKKAAKREAEKARSQEMIARGFKHVGGNKSYQKKPGPIKEEELGWDREDGAMEIRGKL